MYYQNHQRWNGRPVRRVDSSGTRNLACSPGKTAGTRIGGTRRFDD
jgi:hypothetical protein